MPDNELDSLLGELPEGDPCRLAASDPRVTRLGAFLALERSAQTAALAGVLDSKAAERMAARIVDRVRRDDDRRVEVVGRRRFWGRLLAVSVVAHAVVLGAFSWRHFGAERPASPAEAVGGGVSLVPEPTYGSGAELVASADPRETAVAGFRLDPDAPLPVEMLLEPDPSEALVGMSGTEPLFPTRALGLNRAMWVRTSDPMKRLIEQRVGSSGSLDRVQATLRGLAHVQSADGAFPAADGAPSARATATAILAFLGDGHSSAKGEHRDVVERGIGFLWAKADDPATSAGDRAVALLALAEDTLLGMGVPRSSEAAPDPLRDLRRRAALLSPIAKAVASERLRRSSRASSDPAPYDARWAELALAAAARVGAIPTPAALAFAPGFDPSSIGPVSDVRTAMLDGTVLLKDRQGAAFTAWNSATARTLRARLAADGSVAPEKAEEVALILLALQVAYRTW